MADTGAGCVLSPKFSVYLEYWNEHPLAENSTYLARFSQPARVELPTISQRSSIFRGPRFWHIAATGGPGDECRQCYSRNQKPWYCWLASCWPPWRGWALVPPSRKRLRNGMTATNGAIPTTGSILPPRGSGAEWSTCS